MLSLAEIISDMSIFDFTDVYDMNTQLEIDRILEWNKERVSIFSFFFKLISTFLWKLIIKTKLSKRYFFVDYTVQCLFMEHWSYEQFIELDN